MELSTYQWNPYLLLVLCHTEGHDWLYSSQSYTNEYCPCSVLDPYVFIGMIIRYADIYHNLDMAKLNASWML